MSLDSSFAEFKAREREEARKLMVAGEKEETRKREEVQQNRVYFFDGSVSGGGISGIGIDIGSGLPPHTKLVRYPADAAAHEQKIILLNEASPFVCIRKINE